MSVVSLPAVRASAFISSVLSGWGGLSQKLSARPIVNPRAIAPGMFDANTLLAFDSGKLWSSCDCDAELLRHLLEHYRRPWWAILHNVSSRQGDFDAETCQFPGCFYFDGSYHHVSSEHDVPLAEWNAVLVGFTEIVAIMDKDPSHLLAASGAADEQTMSLLARSTFAVVVSAYDNESWVVADLEA